MLMLRGFLTCAAVLIGSVAAHAFDLHGTTFCGSGAMPGATVRAILTATQTDAGLATTDAGGLYSLNLGAGVYDLVVTPPPGSGCSEATITNKTVAASEAYDIILFLPGNPSQKYPVSGLVTIDGAPASDWAVRVIDQNTDSEIDTSTDANGHYSVSVVAGTYFLLIQHFGGGSEIPQNVNCRQFNFTVAGSTSADLAVSTAAISGVVLGDPSGQPGAGLGVSASNSVGAGNFSCNSSSSTGSASDGTFGPLFVLAGGGTNVSSNAVPGAYSSAGASVDTSSPGAVSGVVLRPTEISNVQVSGRIMSGEGVPLTDTAVRFIDSNTDTEFDTSTDADGRYSLSVPSGTYFFLVQRFGGETGGPFPTNLNCRQFNLPISQATVKDVAVDFATVSGSVISQPANNRLPGRGVSASANGAAGEMTCSSSGQMATDGNGDFGPITLVAGSGQASISEIPGQSSSASVSYSLAPGQHLTGLVLAPVEQSTFTVTGIVRGRNGAPLDGASVRFINQNTDNEFSSTTDVLGGYGIDVPTGTYLVLVQSFGNPANRPTNLNCRWFNVTVDADTTRDVNINIAHVAGRVTTASGIPIAGVSISSNTNDGGTCNSSQNGGSDADGRFDYYLTPGNVNYNFTPDEASGYVAAHISTTLSGDLTQQIVLQLPDVVPPVITTGPTVIHHSNFSVSIQWTTNEVTDARLEYQEGHDLGGAPTVMTLGTALTDHIFTLTGLTPGTEYAYRVSSKDSGNNSVASGVLNFTTHLEGDTTPPLITTAPSPTFIAPTIIRVSWTTNEPATSTVRYGFVGSDLDRTAGNSNYLLNHDVVITGLTPGTAYTLTVESKDPDQNGPTVSEPFDVATTTAGDTTPPTILGLRTECITGTAMAVCWETDEAATSNVAYTNQATGAATTLSRAGLVMTRCMSLNGLQPNTSYSIAVSSADGGSNIGNGGPIVRQTLASADEGAPVISGFTAYAVSPTSARIAWTTDLGASTLVAWGTSPDNLDVIAGDGSVSETSHSVLLTGLPAGSLSGGSGVWVRATSTNPCQQSTSTAVTPVVDRDECSDGSAGCDPSATCNNSYGGFACACGGGLVASGTHCCAVCEGGRERASDCTLADPAAGCDFRPEIADQTIAILAGGAVRDALGKVVASDADGGDALRFTMASGNSGGAFSIDADGTLRVASPTAIAARVGVGFSLRVRVTDGQGLIDTATVLVTVGPAPSACVLAPCAHGSCSVVDDAAVCDCSGTGYTGPKCADDVAECASGNGGCEQACVEEVGGFHCACDVGRLASDGRTCIPPGSCGPLTSCEGEAQVFYGVVNQNGAPAGSIRCQRDADGTVTCQTDEHGVLVVAPVLWCE
ncbi:MAG: carboxypeptidase regulatory-like domain-containing protein [Myxococcota bacterium]